MTSAPMKPWVIETVSPVRLYPIHRICYAVDGLDALRAVLRAHPDEAPTLETWVGDQP